MHVALRLQNHGCRNNPYWWIVAAPARKNIKGRFIEHIGYWIPTKRKTVQRSVILNKYRTLYWLAMGAVATKRVQKCLSFFDMMPKPLIVHGSKTVYEKPSREVQRHLMTELNPYRSKYERTNINRIVEKENENLVRREIMIAHEALHKKQQTVSNDQYNIAALEQEWTKLQAQVRQLEKDTKVIDPVKRDALIQRINEVATQWKSAKDIADFQKLRDPYAPVTESNFQKQAIVQNIVQKQEKNFEDKKKWFQELKPLSQQELKDFLEKHSRVRQLRIEEQQDIFNEVLNHAARTSNVITKYFVNEFLDTRLENEKIPDNFEQDHFFAKGRKRTWTTDSFPVIMTRVPLHPIPDISQYNPEEYTDISKQHEQQIKNKAYGIPNIYVENDLPGSLRPSDFNFRKKYKAQRGRSRRYRSPPFFNFSTGKQCKDAFITPVEEEYWTTLRNLRS